jgi:hypothetical protein
VAHPPGGRLTSYRSRPERSASATAWVPFRAPSFAITRLR